MRLLLLLPVLLLSSALSAQGVTLRGKVEDVKGTSQFVVDCSNTNLISSNVNLNGFLGQHVLIKGTMISRSGAPLVDVTSIAPTKEIFEIPGNPEIGQRMRFGATFTPGSTVAFFASFDPGFAPVGRAGTLMLDPRKLFKGPTGIISQLGQLEMAITLPNNPALIGRNVYAQAVIFSGGALILSNPDCKTIR